MNLINLVIMVVTSSLIERGATESISILDGATCASYVVTQWRNGMTCENLIDPNKLTTMTSTVDGGENYETPDFTYMFNGQKEVQTVFIDNRYGHSSTRYINPSRITVGNNPNPTLNAICFDNITDGGWYECDQVLQGDYISIYRTISVYTDEDCEEYPWPCEY